MSDEQPEVNPPLPPPTLKPMKAQPVKEWPVPENADAIDKAHAALRAGKPLQGDEDTE